MTHQKLTIWFGVGHLAIDWPIASLWIIVPAAGITMGLTPAEVGLLFTVFSIGGALAFLPAGVLADHLSNPKRMLVATFWWVAAGYCLAAIAPDFWSLALLLSLAGIGNAAWHPVAAAVLTRASQDRRAEALGLHALGGSAAEILAPVVAGLLLSIVSWQSTLVLSVIPTMVIAVCFYWGVSNLPDSRKVIFHKQDLASFLETWRTARGVGIVTLACLHNLALIALLSMIPLYLVDAHGFDVGTVGLTFAALLVAGAVMQPWLGRASDAFGRRAILVAGTLISGAGSLALALDLSMWSALVALAIAVAASDAIRAVVLATIAEHSGQREGTALGLAFLLMDGVGALGAVLAGTAATLSWSAMFVFAAAASLGASAIAFAGIARSAPAN